MRLPPRNGLPRALAVAAAFAVAVGGPSSAVAADAGGTSAPVAGTPATGTPTLPAGTTGGTRPGASAPQEPRDERTPRTKRRKKKRTAPRPVLTAFHANARRFFDLGRPARVVFRIDGRGRTVRVKLAVLRGGKRIRTIDVGDRALGRSHSVGLTGREGGRLPEGALQLRLTARDSRGRGLRASGRASAVDRLSFYWHRMPLTGPFQYGGEGSRFGAGRPGHIHQGQDLTAPEGTPVVAPRGGEVQTVAYQAGGAGYYVVLKAAGENRSYVFMHLREGSTRVREGQQVATGERLGDVGTTGSSSGPHLHFEVWVGPWYDGGQAVDSLPDLLRWDAWS